MKKLLPLLGLIVFMSCGKPPKRGGEPVQPTPPPTEPTDPSVPTPGGIKLTLRLFGAPWCTNCKSDFPKINEALRNELTGANASVRGELYVETGETPSKPPTEDIAKSYRDFLKLEAVAYADDWPWKKFREQVQPDRKLPGAVVMDKDGNVLKVFIPGPTTFVAEEIVSFVKSKL